jgi:hypothetical protein
MRRGVLSIVLSVVLLATTGYELVPDSLIRAAARRDAGVAPVDGARALLFIPADGQTTVVACGSQRASRELVGVSRPVHVTNTALRAPAVIEPAAHPPAFHRKQPLARALSDQSPVPD